MQQVSARLPVALSRACPLLLLGGLLLAGCQKQEITSFSAPKDVAPTKLPAGIPVSASAPTPIQWTTPAGWQEQPANGIRVGSFTINKDGKQADVSVIPLGAMSGSELDNVNRWRGQVGLAPIGAAELSGAGEKVTVGSAPASLYDMLGTDPKSRQPARILASSISAQGATWFFKMLGSDALVEQEKLAFKEFLKSVRFQASPALDQPPVSQSLMSASAAQSAMLSAHGESSADKPTWELPSGWQEQPVSAMRAATFQVSGENGTKAEVSVIKLAGPAGGVLANVNRWRSQVGLQPVEEAELEKLITIQDAGGVKITFADMAGRSVETGDQARMLAAIVPRSGGTWFYKMLGADQLVSQQKPAFIKFVETARYPNG